MTFEQSRIQAQVEYDNKLPVEVQPEKDLSDLLDELCSERHELHIDDAIYKAIRLIKDGVDHDFKGLHQRRYEMQQYCSQSDQWKVARRQASRFRESLAETLDGLIKLLTDEDKDKLKNFIEELI